MPQTQQQARLAFELSCNLLEFGDAARIKTAQQQLGLRAIVLDAAFISPQRYQAYAQAFAIEALLLTAPCSAQDLRAWLECLVQHNKPRIIAIDPAISDSLPKLRAALALLLGAEHKVALRIASPWGAQASCAILDTVHLRDFIETLDHVNALAWFDHSVTAARGEIVRQSLPLLEGKIGLASCGSAHTAAVSQLADLACDLNSFAAGLAAQGYCDPLAICARSQGPSLDFLG